MKIHNLMEDIVMEKVQEIYEEESLRMKEKGYCLCRQCRMDVACYVLNRVPSRYATSARGLAHLRYEYQNNMQKMADLVRNINDGIKQVSAFRRPNYDHLPEEQFPSPDPPLFNFPTIMGRLLNGKTFEPMADIDIHLRQQGEPVGMIDPGWMNPFHIVDETQGNFLFWPYPKQTGKENKREVFDFELVVEETEQYDELYHYFSLELESENFFIDSVHLQRSTKIPDLYLFPKG